MAQIEGEIIIGRPSEVVFDFVADERNEPSFNPRMVRAERVSGGPIGAGTRFRAATKSMGRVLEMTSSTRDRSGRHVSTRLHTWLPPRRAALLGSNRCRSEEHTSELQSLRH